MIAAMKSSEFFAAVKSLGYLRNNFVLVNKQGSIFVASCLNHTQTGRQQCEAVLTRAGVCFQWEENAISDFFGNPCPAYKILQACKTI